MSLPRVVIAAVFLIIGAVLLIPVLTDSSSSTPVARGAPLTGGTASGGGTVSASPSHGAAKSPAKRPTKTPAHRPSATGGGAGAVPPVTPATPLSVTIGQVRCPGRTVQVTVVNGGRQAQDYAVLADGSIAVADRIPAGATRKSTLNLTEDRTTAVGVTWNNIPAGGADRYANCVRPQRGGQTLPHTGPDRGMIVARVATGLAAVLVGVIVFWYGRLWPRRRSGMYDE